MKCTVRPSLVFFCLCIQVFAQQAGAQVGRRDPDDTVYMIQKTVAELRRSSPGVQLSRTYYIPDEDMRGSFIYDARDNSSPDDSVMTLVTANGLRFKRSMDNGPISVRWFGAKGDGAKDDWYAIQKAINYILNNPNAGRTLFFPAGNYRISRPLLIARLRGKVFDHVSINLIGPANSKTIAEGYASILPDFNNVFAVGIQVGKGVLIKDLVIIGKFSFPNTLSPIQVDTLSFAQWTDGSCRDNQYSPYAGIVIDPFSDSTKYKKSSDMYPGLHAWCPAGMHQGGSTSVQVVGCSIRNFIVGFMITPSLQQNGELIDLIDCELSGNKVGYAMGQAQSKECHVNRLKCWQPTHTVFDNMSYGFRKGDGAAVPMVDGVNIASNVKQLCRILSSSFGGTFRNVYAEGLFRLGYAGGPATLSFEDCQLDFASQDPGLPYPDFYVLGSNTAFHDCMLRLYPGVKGARLILSGTNNSYENGVMNAPPVAVNLDNNGVFQNPFFRHVTMYYSGGILGSGNHGIQSAASPFKGSNGGNPDPVYFNNIYAFRDPGYGVDLLYKFTYHEGYERTARLSGNPVMHVDKSRWTAWFKLGKSADTALLKTGDFILTSGLSYQDQMAGTIAATNPVGFVSRIGHDTVWLNNLALGIEEGMKLRLWMDYFVNELPPFTGDMEAGSNTIIHVQGEFPSIGDRWDIPFLPSGTFITAVDRSAGTVSFSAPNITGHSYKDRTFMNGYPRVEMYSSYDLPTLQKYGKTLIGGGHFYRLRTKDLNTDILDYPVRDEWEEEYINLNTNFRGDSSLHRFRYRPASAGGRLGLSGVAPQITSSSGGATITVTGNGTDLQLAITVNAPVKGEMARIRLSGMQPAVVIAVISNANAFTAANSSAVYCSTEDPSILAVGGSFAAAGNYLFNIHVGQ